MKQYSRVIPFLIALLLLCLPFTVSADEIPAERQLPLLVDDADILTDTEEAMLLNRLERLSESLRCDIAVITVATLGEYDDAQALADDWYDYNGYGYGSNDDGALFLIAMTERQWAISTYGTPHYAITDPALDEIEGTVVPLLSDGSYYQAFSAFADACDSYIRYYRDSGTEYEEGSNPWADNSWVAPILNAGKTTPNYFLRAVVSIAIGAIIAFIVVGRMKSKLKSVGFQSGAKAYIVPGSLAVKQSSDVFLYKNVSRVRRETESSSSGSHGGGTHTSSSGRSHGGRSGGF